MPEATLPRAIALWAEALTENNELDEKPNIAASSLERRLIIAERSHHSRCIYPERVTGSYI
jgi:hypothetical protein